MKEADSSVADQAKVPWAKRLLQKRDSRSEWRALLFTGCGCPAYISWTALKHHAVSHAWLLQARGNSLKTNTSATHSYPGNENDYIRVIIFKIKHILS